MKWVIQSSALVLKTIFTPGWRRFCKPVLKAKRLHNISIKELLEMGITHLIIDTDGVLVRFGSDNIPKENILWIAEAERQGIKLYMTTFNRKDQHAKRVAGKLNLHFLAMFTDDLVKHVKDCFEIVQGHQQIDPRRIGIINDSLFCLGLFRKAANNSQTIFIEESGGITNYNIPGSIAMELIFLLERLFLRHKE